METQRYSGSRVKFDYDAAATKTSLRELRARCWITPTGCWQWTGSINDKGYAIVWIDKVKLRAHRVSFILAKGPVPVGHEPDHECENTACINPDHLNAVTHQRNIERAYEKKGLECPLGHGPFHMRPADGWLYCKTCMNEYQRKRALMKLLKRYNG